MTGAGLGVLPAAVRDQEVTPTYLLCRVPSTKKGVGDTARSLETALKVVRDFKASQQRRLQPAQELGLLWRLLRHRRT